MGYLAGFLVGAKYATNSPKTESKKGRKPESFGEKTIAVGKEFVESHKHAFADLKKEYWTAENKKLVLSKKKDLDKFFALVQDEFSEAQEVLKKHGVDTKAIVRKLEEIYQDKKVYLEQLGKTPAARTAKKKLTDLAKKIKESL